MGEKKRKPSCCEESGARRAAAPCCGGPTAPCDYTRAGTHWLAGSVAVAGRSVPRAATQLQLADSLGALAVRLSVGRMSYAIQPGLYAVGSPAAGDPVLVSANYKLSFDRLRGVLAGRNAWVLVLDTRGINVWCAAGKGTFGTDELVARVEAEGLGEVVSHRTLIVPQLGAPGVAAHEVRRRCGFRVVYGPVRAADLPAFLDAGMTAAEPMRRVTFGLVERAVLIPIEMRLGVKYALWALAVTLLLSCLGPGGFSLHGLGGAGLRGAAMLAATFLAGTAAAPLLLPWLPGRAFSVKGAIVGAVVATACAALTWPDGPAAWLEAGAWLAVVPAGASFLAMNFTGASTYTSLSGVRKEMRFALPCQIAALVLGAGLWAAARLIGGAA
jgi:acetyl-CoA decarbonylase/synthase complex subunit gamma